MAGFSLTNHCLKLLSEDDMLLPEEREHQRACDLAIWHEILLEIAQRLWGLDVGHTEAMEVLGMLGQQYPELLGKPLMFLDRKVQGFEGYTRFVASLTEELRPRSLTKGANK